MTSVNAVVCNEQPGAELYVIGKTLQPAMHDKGGDRPRDQASVEDRPAELPKQHAHDVAGFRAITLRMPISFVRRSELNAAMPKSPRQAMRSATVSRAVISCCWRIMSRYVSSPADRRKPGDRAGTARPLPQQVNGYERLGNLATAQLDAHQLNDWVGHRTPWARSSLGWTHRKIGHDADNFSRVCIDEVVIERAEQRQRNALTDGVGGDAYPSWRRAVSLMTTGSRSGSFGSSGGTSCHGRRRRNAPPALESVEFEKADIDGALMNRKTLPVVQTESESQPDQEWRHE